MIAVFFGAAVSYLVKAYTGNMAVPLPNILFYLLIGAIVESQMSLISAPQPITTDDKQERRWEFKTPITREKMNYSRILD
jgi:hypothetical protein